MAKTDESSPLLVPEAEDAPNATYPIHIDREDKEDHCVSPQPRPRRLSAFKNKAIFGVPPLRHDRDIRYDPHHIINHKSTVSYDTLPFKRSKSQHIQYCQQVMTSVMSIVIAVVLILMVCVPFGLSFFPAEWKDIPVPRAIGIQMFLLTTVICQVIFGLTSSFKCPIGLMMVENIPFMHTLATSILNDVGRENIQALPTIVVTYSISSIFVGILFFLLGYFRMGSIIYFFPKHIIIGAIGGIGIFVVQTGFENATGIPFQWSASYFAEIVQPQVIWLWITAVILVVLLSFLKYFIQSHYFSPFFFISIPPLFYLVLAMLQINVSDAVANGWFFDKAPHVEFWDMWLLFDFKNVAWWAIPRQFGTLMGLSLFSLMHVPINIPSLSLTTGTEVDINDELIAHGYSNTLGGCVGSVQNYLCYSFSALYYKCNGTGKINSMIIAAITSFFFFIGPNAVSYIPRCMAGCIMIHIGFDLIKEAIIDTYQDLDMFEYLTVCVISLTMTFWGMNQGLAVGAVLACITFVVQGAPTGPIRGSMCGATLRSNAWRTPTALDILDDISRYMYVVQLQGHVFFGNILKLSTYINDILNNHPEIEYLVTDFTLVAALDSSAAERLSKVKHLCNRRGCHLVFAAIPETYDRFRCQMLAAFGENAIKPQATKFHIATDLNNAIEWCEDGLLERHTMILTAKARSHALQKPLLFDEDDECAHIRQLQALCPGQSLSTLYKLLDYFSMREIEAGTTLWRQGQQSNSAILLADGGLIAEIEEEAGTTENISVGSLVGELCLLTGEKRKSSLHATKRSVIYVLSRTKLEEMIQYDSQLAFLFQGIALRYMSYRLQYVGNRIWETKCLPI